jgi:hypothetical protein
MERPRRLRFVPWAVTFVLAFILTACSSGPDQVAYPTTTPPALSRTVTFQGVSIRVPSYFRVYSTAPCNSTGDLVVVGAPEAIGECDAFSPLFRTTAVKLTTEEAIPPNSQIWTKPRVIGGLTMVSGAEASATTCSAVSTCTTTASVVVKIPNTGVALIIWAGGSAKSGALDLANSIIDSIHTS